ncbi:DEAD-box ATP-dependent RNA helicase 13 [Camellia lanceoleosa]|uniref:DEAD-box ATP-dependent RNA helicase 13 n=1 Tax=Camellia lanceoleosa TaxID=1840588 RepID=A0ACC0I9S9_9ERIC|nr:DEAD-box ATP-dependent RNA helicase 13 [Camellia lanceoleosa]
MASKKKPNKAKRPRQGFEQLDRFDSLPWNSSLFENDDPFSISVGSSELEGGFLSLEEIDESEYGLEIPKPKRENKKERTKENKNEKKKGSKVKLRMSLVVRLKL